MSESKTTNSDSFNSEDKKHTHYYDEEDNTKEEHYFDDEIDEEDEDYFFDEEIDEDDEDYFFDEEEPEEVEDVEEDEPHMKQDKNPDNQQISQSNHSGKKNSVKGSTERKADVKEHHTKKKSLKKLWIILGSVIGVLAAAYIGVSVFFMSHFYINTEINGHDFSGKTVADVETYLKEQVKGYKLTVLEKDNKSDSIDGNEISLKYKENDDIKNALKKQNGFLWPSALFSKNSAKVTIEVSYDEAALEAKIQNLQAVTTEQIAPVSASPKFDGEKYVVEPEVIGTAVNMDVLKEKIPKVISEFDTEFDMEKEDCYAIPKFTSESEEVKKACETMNNYCKASITYTMTESVVVDKTLISTWVTADENMKVTFNEEAVKNWLTEFGNKFDTVGTTRTITSPTGKTAEVSGGTYGWSIDEDTEFTALTSSIQNGETVSKEPAYYQTAASHTAADWGNTYVEVDLSAQYMWYIVNGSIALQTDIVTGYPTPEKETPSGVYNILEMQRNKTLIGAIVPETGKPEYETPVSFWMRVTWTGIGFHDATWQPAFGGSLYQSVGSHGCINMPYDQAEALYGMLAMGTPVIMHY